MKPPAAPLLATALALSHPRTVALALSASSKVFAPVAPAIHTVDGIPCRELAIRIKNLNADVTILEATSEGQERLVNAAIMEEEDYDDGEASEDRDLVREDPYGAVLWPAASAVSEHITSASFWDHEKGQPTKPALLEMGTGTGLVSLAAASSGKFESVAATDYETVPLRLLDAACELNRGRRADDAAPMAPISTSIFDICDLSTSLPDADIACAADVLYLPKTGVALARRTVEALERGTRVVVGCSPGRPGRPAFLEELRRLRPNIRGAEFRDVEGTTCTGERHDLICGEESTSVSVEPKMLLVALMSLAPGCLG